MRNIYVKTLKSFLVLIFISIGISCGSEEPGYEPANFTEEDAAWLSQKIQESYSEGSITPVVLTDEEIATLQQKVQNAPSDPVTSTEYAVIDTEHGIIILEFYPDVAPKHAASFKKLANNGFYDWTLFHRVIPGFMIQGGDVLSKNDNAGDDGQGSPGYFIDAETSGVKHRRGILSMARGNNPNSAGSQFFIMHDVYPTLDGLYSIFGNVVKGIEVVDAIVNTPKTPGGINDPHPKDRPLTNQYMKRVRVFDTANK